MIDKTEDICFERLMKIQELETQLRVRERPTVAIKNLREEIFRVKTANVTTNEDNYYWIRNSTTLEDEPNKILETGPAPQPTVFPTATPKGKKRNRSKSPENPSQKQSRSEQVTLQTQLQTSSSLDPSSECLSAAPPPSVTSTRKRKRKREKAKEKKHDDIS